MATWSRPHVERAARTADRSAADVREELVHVAREVSMGVLGHSLSQHGRAAGVDLCGPPGGLNRSKERLQGARGCNRG